MFGVPLSILIYLSRTGTEFRGTLKSLLADVINE
jgi:hypothetical protein